MVQFVKKDGSFQPMMSSA